MLRKVMKYTYQSQRYLDSRFTRVILFQLDIGKRLALRLGGYQFEDVVGCDDSLSRY